MNKLLITKSNLNEIESQRLSQLDIKLICKSFIRFEAHNFSLDNLNDFDWIFFSSPRAFDYFLAGVDLKIINTKKIACVGRKTAEHLSIHLCEPDFIGQKSGEISSVAQALKELIGDKRVLFPISNISNKSMQKALNKGQYTNLVVYKTIIKSQKLNYVPNTVVFTSPSNVDAYLTNNRLTSQQKIIAWGSTTQKHIEKKGYKCAAQLEESSIDSLIYLLKTRKDLLS